MRAVAFLFLCLGVSGIMAWPVAADAQAVPAAAALGMPAAAIQADSPVPMKVVEHVAREKAQQVWGEVALGEPIPCADQDGKLAYYMVPVRFGADRFPDYETVMREVRQGRAQKGAVQKGELPPGLNAVEPPRRGGMTLHRNPDIAVAPTLALDGLSYAQAYRAGQEKAMGAGKYGTVVVAATYDRFPIPLYTNYLPPYYVTGDLAQRKAKESLGEEPALSRIYFLGRRGTYFEFTAAHAAVTIHAFTLEPAEIERVEHRQPTPQESDRVSAQWAALTR